MRAPKIHVVGALFGLLRLLISFTPSPLGAAASSWYQRQLLMEQQQQQLLQMAAQQHQQSARPTCPYCRKELKNVHSLNVHISRYHSTSNESSVEVICPVCDRKYGNKYSLRTHMHLNHKGQLHLLGSAKKGRKAAAAEGGPSGAQADSGGPSNEEGKAEDTGDKAEQSEQFYY